MDVRKYFVWKCIIFSYYLWHIYSNIFCKEHTYMQFHVNMIYKFVNFAISTRYLLRTMSAELLHLFKENRKWISAILAAPIPFGENYSVLGKVLSLTDHYIGSFYNTSTTVFARKLQNNKISNLWYSWFVHYRI